MPAFSMPREAAVKWTADIICAPIIRTFYNPRKIRDNLI